MKVIVFMMLFGLGVLHAENLAVEKKKFLAADKALNEAYQSAKKALLKELFVELQEDQRGWVPYRDLMSRRLALFETGKEANMEGQAAYWSMMTAFTEDRTSVLKGWMHVQKEGKWDGVYSDSYGGSITLKQKGDRLHFKIDVVRGPTSHLGEIEGVAEINQQAARYSDGGKEHEGTEKTWLDFEILDGARVKVSGINTWPYHGARAHFDGTYVRIRR